MRVLHVAESIKGGCGTYLDELVPVQIADPTIKAVRVLVPQAHAGQLVAIPAAQIRTFPHPVRSLRALAALLGTLHEEMATFKPDVVHLHSTFAGLLGRPLLALRPKRFRVVYCAHGWAFDMRRASWKLKIMKLAERLLAPFADRIVAISDYERRSGLEAGIAPARLVTVLNGLADQDPPPALQSDGRLRLLFVGRLDFQKGYDVLLEAVEGLGDRLDVRLVGASVVGDQAVERVLPSHVTALGWCSADKIRRELAAADLVVVPSRWEGFGLVALEAMRAGRAVLASRVGGLPEVVNDGVTGRLVAPGDASALRAALLDFDAPTTRRMGEAGRARFLAHFTIAQTAQRIRDVYHAGA